MSPAPEPRAGEEIRQLALQFAAAGLAIVERGLLAQTDALGLERRPYYRDGSYEERASYSPTYSVMRYLARELESLPEAQALLGCLLDQDSIPAKHDAPADASPFDRVVGTYRDALLGPVVDYLMQTESFSLDEALFWERFQQYQHMWRTGNVRQQVVVPIRNLHPAFPVSELLESGVIWSSFSPDDQTRLWRIARPDGEEFTTFDLGVSGSAVVGEVAATLTLYEGGEGYQVEFQSTGPIWRVVRRLITALRLLHEGDVGVSTMLTYDELPQLLGRAFPHKIAELRTPGVAEFAATIPYQLSHDDVREVRVLLAQLAQVERSGQSGSLGVAMRWFHRSYSRESPEDRVVDLAVALESSLLAGMGDQSELSYRLALRGATLLRTVHPTDDTFSLLRATYAVRSKIVHTGRTLEEISQSRSSPFKGRDHTTFAVEVRECVRRVLREYVGRIASGPPGTTAAAVNDQLEEEVLQALARER